MELGVQLGLEKNLGYSWDWRRTGDRAEVEWDWGGGLVAGPEMKLGTGRGGRPRAEAGDRQICGWNRDMTFSQGLDERTQGWH